MESLLCGARVREPLLQEQLRQNALLHLFVVSGAHLLWLDQWLRRIHLPLWCRGGLWVFFSLACGWQPPIVRALVALGARQWGGRWLHGLRPDQESLVAGVATLVLFPAWISSLSLALSWAAALALTLAWGEGWRREWRQGLFLWLCLLPLLAAWSFHHPLGVLINLFLAPVFSVIFLPLGAVCVLFPWFSPLFDFLFGAFRHVLGLMPSFQPDAAGGAAPRAEFFWLWLIFLHVLIHLVRLRQKRRRG
ncbi:MAG: ComEC/Rec2 family competence protein [Bdellovibrionaceae bacterium]|nr:ComEC/Rec2 family competence protein [Pseudobdellovibrionaceae bacterium]